LAGTILGEDREGAIAWLRTLPGEDLRREIVAQLQGHLRNEGRDEVAERLEREVLGAP
jgi:hypothetical protein